MARKIGDRRSLFLRTCLFLFRASKAAPSICPRLVAIDETRLRKTALSFSPPAGGPFLPSDGRTNRHAKIAPLCLSLFRGRARLPRLPPRVGKELADRRLIVWLVPVKRPFLPEGPFLYARRLGRALGGRPALAEFAASPTDGLLISSARAGHSFAHRNGSPLGWRAVSLLEPAICLACPCFCRRATGEPATLRPQRDRCDVITSPGVTFSCRDAQRLNGQTTNLSFCRWTYFVAGREVHMLFTRTVDCGDDQTDDRIQWLPR